MAAIFLLNSMFFAQCAEMKIRVFLRSLIIILRSKMRNSKKLRIKYRGHFRPNSTFFVQIAQKWVWAAFWGRSLQFRGRNWEIHNSGFNMAAIFLLNLMVFFFKLHKNEYKGVSEVADLDSEVKNEKFKVANSILRPFE